MPKKPTNTVIIHQAFTPVWIIQEITCDKAKAFTLIKSKYDAAGIKPELVYCDDTETNCALFDCLREAGLPMRKKQ